MKTIWQLVREDQQKQLKIKDQPCKCNAYKFPHRRNGGHCVDDCAWMTLSDKLEFADRLNKSERYQ